jgi:hypothetical protein
MVDDERGGVVYQGAVFVHIAEVGRVQLTATLLFLPLKGGQNIT